MLSRQQKIFRVLAIGTIAFLIFGPAQKAGALELVPEAHAQSGVVRAGGAAAGAVLGTKIGAGIGSIVPGVGTVAGGIVGGVIGGAGGFFLAGSAMQSIAGILGSAIGYVVFVINYIVNLIFSFFIAIITWFIGLILALSEHLVNHIAVKSGFNVTLSIANLGFVLGIIIIAIATILRSQTYGIKQLLWKLVVAAILVNFSLTIAGTIISFSNTLTRHFATPLPGGGGDWFAFSGALSGAFNPQAFLIAQGLEEVGLTPSSIIGAATTTAAVEKLGNFGATLGSILVPLLNLVFNFVFIFVITLTLAALLIMLVVRYVTLAILLVLMPFAWLMWIFPNFTHLWKQWWNTFLRWVFFAPLVMFFLFLAISTAAAISAQDQSNNPFLPTKAIIESTTSGSAQLLAGIKGFVGGLVGQLVSVGAGAAMIIGLAIGGLFAANKLSITGARVALGGLEGAGKAAGLWFAKTGARTALLAGQGLLRPRPRQVPGAPPGVTYTPLPATWVGRQRAKAATWLGKQAQHPALQSPGFFRSVWTGFGRGSGLWGKKAKMWTCQNCGTAVYAVNKPDDNDNCPKCKESAVSMRSKTGNAKYQLWK